MNTASYTNQKLGALHRLAEIARILRLQGNMTVQVGEHLKNMLANRVGYRNRFGRAPLRQANPRDQELMTDVIRVVWKNPVLSR